MANIAFGPLISDASGKIGGVVMTKARSGATTRIRVRPTNPGTARQLASRAALTDAARAYRALSADDRAAWEGYALTLTVTNPVSGHTYSPSTISVFAGLFAKMRQINPVVAVPTTPPATPFVGDVITATVGDLDMEGMTFIGSAANAAGVTTEFLYQRIDSEAVKPDPRLARNVGFHVMAGGDLDPTLTTPVALHPNDHINLWYRFVKVATGQTSPLVDLGKWQINP